MPITITGPQTGIFINGHFDGTSTSLPQSFDIDLSKGWMGLNYATAPDNWSVVAGAMDASVTNVTRGYKVTVTISAFHTTSTEFGIDFTFTPFWNLPL